MRSNRIGVPGLTALGAALYKNSTLRSLSLWGNEFDNSVGRVFLELARNRLPFVGLSIDVEVYVVDGVHKVAELQIKGVMSNA